MKRRILWFDCHHSPARDSPSSSSSVIIALRSSSSFRGCCRLRDRFPFFTPSRHLQKVPNDWFFTLFFASSPYHQIPFRQHYTLTHSLIRLWVCLFFSRLQVVVTVPFLPPLILSCEVGQPAPRKTIIILLLWNKISLKTLLSVPFEALDIAW